MSLPHTDEASGPRNDRVNYQINEFCAVHRIGRSLFYKEVREGELKLIKVRGRSLVTVTEAEAWMQRKAQASCL